MLASFELAFREHCLSVLNKALTKAVLSSSSDDHFPPPPAGRSSSSLGFQLSQFGCGSSSQGARQTA